MNVGDILVNNLRQVKHLILHEGVSTLYKHLNLLYFVFYKSFLFGFSL